MVAEFQRMKVQIEAGEDISHERLEALCASLRQNPDQIPREQAGEVIALIDALTEAMVVAQQDFAGKLGGVKRGRRALRGYSQLRSTHLAQRLHRQG